MDAPHMYREISHELGDRLIPFWAGLRDDKYGGYTGYVGHDLRRDPEAEKGCILNSRILWFFSEAFLFSREENREDKALLAHADHAFRFLRDVFHDREAGGLFWSATYDGKPLDTTKHTYCQAFGIYALSAYYRASGHAEALDLAEEIRDLIEQRCTDDAGYCEAYTRRFHPQSNEKLSENGVMAEKTMNTLLHVLEAYTGLLEAEKAAGRTREKTAAYLHKTVCLYADHIYSPALHHGLVFFDRTYHSLIDLYSYGHDIEAGWLIDRALDVLDDPELDSRIRPITLDISEEAIHAAFDGRSLAEESEYGLVKERRVWWVQAECLTGLLNMAERVGRARTPRHAMDHDMCLDAAWNEWGFIRDYLRDTRPGSEWFESVGADGVVTDKTAIVQPWKCPYHNGRMCIEALRRLKRIVHKNFDGEVT